MKTIQINRLWTVLLLAVAIMFGAVAKSQAQSVTTSITNQFDAANSVSGWTYWYDLYSPPYNVQILDWSSVENNGGAGGSGSLVFSNQWPASPAGHQNQIWGTFAHTGGNQYDFSASVDGSKYDSITFDVHVNANAPTNNQGNIVQLNVGLFSGFGVHGTTNIDIPTSAKVGWYHATALINKGDAPISQGWAMNVNCYGGPNGNLLTNSTQTLLFIDNLQINRTKEVLPPPVLSGDIKNADSGLNLLSSTTTDNQYQRTSIRYNTTTGIGFLGQSGMGYSFTITNFPSPIVYTNYQAHIFIATPDGAASIDYNSPNLIWLNVQGTANGGAIAYFRYKIFEPGANSNLFGLEYTAGPLGTPWAGQLTNITSSTPLGTWGMSFDQDTNVTLSGPDGNTVTFSIRPEVAAQFVEPLNVHFGAQPNQPNDGLANFNRGQKVVLARASITNSGTATSIVNDNFMADLTLDVGGLWVISANAAETVQLFPYDPGAKIVKWSIPDNFFGLQTSTDIANASGWNTLSGSETATPVYTYNLSGKRNALVPSASLGPDQNFFRLFTRKFSKLQVLMPGETAAPGTATGKTGTPDPQAAGVPFSVIVNSVNQNWYPAPYASDHVLHFTSSDPLATLPANSDLINGSATVSVTFNSNASSFTVTASDVTDPTKTADTSSPVSVP